MDKTTFDKGVEVRTAVLGKQYVENALKNVDEFNKPFQELVTEYCWGAVWGRDELPRKTRSMLNLAMIAILNRPHELKLHIKGALTNGVTYSYNPYYFATPATAQKVAQMTGGKVLETNNIVQFGPFQQSHPNQMVELPSGRVINAGLFASFYDHGYSQPYIDRLISSEINDRPA